MVKLFDYRLHITVQEQHSVLIGNSSETKVDDDEKLTYLLCYYLSHQKRLFFTRNLIFR